MCAFKRIVNVCRWHVNVAFTYIDWSRHRGKDTSIITNTCVAYTHDAHDWDVPLPIKCKLYANFQSLGTQSMFRRLPILKNKLSTRWTACFGFPEWLQGNRTRDNGEQALMKCSPNCIESNRKLALNRTQKVSILRKFV